jgi:hypothetical protein
MGDKLDKLPSTRIASGVAHDNPEDIQILTSIFGTPETVNTITQVCSSNKDIITASILFLIINLPLLDGIIKKIYKNAENPWILLLVKTLLFAILLFFTLNSKLALK